jgi:hypothetical protein
VGRVPDDFSVRYRDLLTGTYDCVDRVVHNAYFSLAHSPGGFRTWWRRWHDDGDNDLDNAHLMCMAGRFSRRVRRWAQVNGVPVIDCKAGERKHLIAEEHLRDHRGIGPGVFMILVAKAPATTWDVQRSQRGVLRNLAKKKTYVNHYSFHIIDPAWGHVTIKMSGHPPFGAQVILNGHERVAAMAAAAGVEFGKEGSCFTEISDPADLAELADTLSQPAAKGRLGQVCDRWIYSACLCFGLDLGDQERSRFVYDYSIYQVEYSRNLLFASGATMDRVFDTVVDRTRSRLDVPTLRTLFGVKQRPRTNRPDLSPRVGCVIETPQYGLTIFKVHFGALTLKGYTKGEHVLRFEAVCHNTNALRVGRILDRFPDIVAALAGMLERFCTTLDCVDVTFVPDGVLDQLPQPTLIGRTRVGGIDLQKPRTRTALTAIVALTAAPDGFSVADLVANVHAITTEGTYRTRQAAYDLRKLRGHNLVTKVDHTHRYHLPAPAARTIVAILTLRDQVISPIIAGVRVPRRGRPPATWTVIDRDYETPSDATCTRSSTTSPSTPPPHRQQVVDQGPQAPRQTLK